MTILSFGGMIDLKKQRIEKSLLRCGMELDDPAKVAETWANEIIACFEIQELEWSVKLSKDYEIRSIAEENVKYWNFRYSAKKRTDKTIILFQRKCKTSERSEDGSR